MDRLLDPVIRLDKPALAHDPFRGAREPAFNVVKRSRRPKLRVYQTPGLKLPLKRSDVRAPRACAPSAVQFIEARVLSPC
jgi:hypothetical protein